MIGVAPFIAQTKFAYRIDSMRFERPVPFGRQSTLEPRRHSSNDATGPLARTVDRLSAPWTSTDVTFVAVVKRSVANRACRANWNRTQGPLV